ncbi:hypothetical protein L914_13174, partial [Phytophthora nicotianae]
MTVCYLSNKDTNLLEDEIMCSLIVTVSSRSKPVLSWLKVASSRRFLVSSKQDFVLRGNRFTGYKKESMTQQVGAEGSTIFIKNVKIEISDPRNLMFIITTPELSKAGQEAHPYGDVDKGVQQ